MGLGMTVLQNYNKVYNIWRSIWASRIYENYDIWEFLKKSRSS